MGKPEDWLKGWVLKNGLGGLGQERCFPCGPSETGMMVGQ